MTEHLNPESLIACPQCDALYQTDGEAHLVCDRCHNLLVAPGRRAGYRLLALSLVSVALVYGAITQPFLTVERFWIESDATLLEAAFAFEGPLLILSAAVVLLVLVLPTLRLALMLYVLAPAALGRASLPLARRAFRWSESLRPWSMAEIFALGCGVALVKIADLAEVRFGPAFWMFAALVVLIWVRDRLICRYSLWSLLDER